MADTVTPIFELFLAETVSQSRLDCGWGDGFAAQDYMREQERIHAMHPVFSR
jgi:competence transcription factor ComK